MDTPTAKLIELMQERVVSLRAVGNLQDALHAANAVVQRCEQELGPDLETVDAFASSLEQRAGIFIDMGMHAEAAEDLKQAIEQLENRPDRLAQAGRLFALLGAAYDGQGRTEKVTEAWTKAVALFEKNEPPLLLDVAAISNNLGFMAKKAGSLGEAEDYFLRALEIAHNELGRNHEETAAICNNLGAMYHAAGYLEQAREMHMMALESRREIFGENHPDTAQSHNNLALALLQTGDRTWARRHFEKSLAAYESLGAEYSEDLEAVASNYCNFLREEGEESLADVIDGRVKELLAIA